MKVLIEVDTDVLKAKVAEDEYRTLPLSQTLMAACFLGPDTGARDKMALAHYGITIQEAEDGAVVFSSHKLTSLFYGKGERPPSFTADTGHKLECSHEFTEEDGVRYCIGCGAKEED